MPVDLLMMAALKAKSTLIMSVSENEFQAMRNSVNSLIAICFLDHFSVDRSRLSTDYFMLN